MEVTEQNCSLELRLWLESQLESLALCPAGDNATEWVHVLLAVSDENMASYCVGYFGDKAEVQGFAQELISRRNKDRKSLTVRSKKGKRRRSKASGSVVDDSVSVASGISAVSGMFSHLRGASKKKGKRDKSGGSQPTVARSGAGMKITYTKEKPKGAKAKDSKSKMLAKTAMLASTDTSEKQLLLKSLVGARKCGCQATAHGVYTNCTLCGYVLCLLESEGLCPHCESGYVTKTGTIAIGTWLHASDAHLSKQSGEALAIALSAKERLLRFGREKAVRTRVVDDQGDFYESEAASRWLSTLERQRAKEKALDDESRLHHTATGVSMQVDVAKGQFVDGGAKAKFAFSTVDRDKQLAEAMAKERQEAATGQQLKRYYGSGHMSTRAAEVFASLQQLMEAEKSKVDAYIKKSAKEKANEATGVLADGSYVDSDEDSSEESSVEDAESSHLVRVASGSKHSRRRWAKRLGVSVRYTDEKDSGVCISMHQPWASLLVHGIKRVEGRLWSTGFRNRLWVAAAKREPTPLEIETVEAEYIEMYGANSREEIGFPSHYPTSALLGCVDLIDCVSQSNYRSKYLETALLNERNKADHCFICENPRVLLLPGFISGDHKLWKMPTERLRTVQRALIPADTRWRDTGTSKKTSKRKRKRASKKQTAEACFSEERADIGDRTDAAPKCTPMAAAMPAPKCTAVPMPFFDWSAADVIESISYKTALCVGPLDEAVVGELNSVRVRLDPAYPRWMPHLNLIYPFVGSKHFEAFAKVASDILESKELLRRTRLKLQCTHNCQFGQKSALNIHLRVANKAADDWLRAVVSALLEPIRVSDGFETSKKLKSMCKKKFTAHLTVAKVPKNEAATVHTEMQRKWGKRTEGVQFAVDQLWLISREKAPEKPFEIVHSILLK